jgi:predicted O-methyltransferase YrrM
MIPITDKKVEEYIYGILPERDGVLRAMENEAKKREIPIVGPAVARLFFQLASLVKAKTVFELGSAIGYSTIWWARAVGAGGRVVYTDSDTKNAAEARGYFEKAGVADRIDIRIGDALEALAKEKPESFDIIFNDVDKTFYPRVFPLAAARVRRGGLFVTDNVLWSGRVAQKNPKDSDTKAIVEFNRLLYSSRDFFTTIIPLRDGVAVAQRL